MIGKYKSEAEKHNKRGSIDINVTVDLYFDGLQVLNWF